MLSGHTTSEETIALAQSEDVIAGTAMEHVILDETYKLAIGFEKSKNQYMTEIKESIRKQTGI